MTILEILQAAALELRIPSRFTSVIGSTDAHVRLLLGLANAEIREIRRDYQWPELISVGTITLVAAQSTYALQADFDSLVDKSGFNTSDSQPLMGPVSPAEWSGLQYSVSGFSLGKNYRIEGITDRRFNIFPTPGTSEAGQILAYRYRSNRGARPKTWTTNTSAAAGSWIFYNGNYYTTTAGGTTGATAPTHITGAISDGGVTWTYSQAEYSTFLADTDVPLFDSEVVKVGVMYRWQKVHRFDYGPDMALHDKLEAAAYAKNAPNGVLDLAGRSTGIRYLDYDNIPD